MEFKIVNRFDKNRVQVENFIKEKYLNIFNAKIESFPAILVAIFDQNHVKAACGIRTALDGFFSEASPIASSTSSGRPGAGASSINF